MWLRNWYSILNAFLLSRTDDAIPGENPTDTPPITVRNTSGTYVKHTAQTVAENSYETGNLKKMLPGKFKLYLGNAYSSVSSDGFTLIFGTGTTPVSLDDYRIETPITSGLSMASSNTTLVNKTALNNGRYSFKTRSAINNTSASQITINEIALQTPPYFSGFNGAACVYREVLSTPIVLDPGDTVLVEFEWDAPIYAAPTP